MSDKKGARSRLLELSGGVDLNKRPSLTASVLEEVMAEQIAEREATARAEFKELIAKAFELEKKRTVARQQFEQADAKFEKELGKLVSGAERQLAQEVPESPCPEPEPTPPTPGAPPQPDAPGDAS